MSESAPEPSSSKSSKMDFLTRKVGPLPAIAWAGIALVGYFLWRHFFGSKTPVASAGMAQPSTATVDNAGDSYDPGGYAMGDYSPTGFTPTGGSGPFSSAGNPTNNQGWSLYVEEQLAGSGKYSPLDVTRAITDFLNGRTLDATEQQIVNDAIKSYGVPPQGVDTVDLGSPPARGPVESQPRFIPVIVDDLADEQIAIAAGAPANTIRWSGQFSPNYSRLRNDPSYAPPNAPPASPDEMQRGLFLGSAGKYATGPSAIKIQGATRTETQQQFKTWLQSHSLTAPVLSGPIHYLPLANE